ncbi:MAG TPA: hypothetical protein VNA14_02325 [Mycobacteriales bacterium]|nr:hypothetical protein [Mycobacteriales bacterium]
MTPTARRRTTYAVALIVVTLAACSDSDGDSAPRAVSTTAPAAASSSVPASGGPAPTSAAPGTAVTATAVPAPGTTTNGLPSQTSPTPVSSAPPGPQAKARSAAPGRYTLDVTGTFRTDTGETPTNGEATLTIDPPTGDDQHSSLAAGQTGSTEQTVRFTATAIELVQLKIGSPGFVKEFRPVRPVLLLPQPPTVGRSWSWTVVSTDGATTASLTAKVARTETVVIGGEQVASTVVHSTLKLTGDITATSVMDTWYADRYHVSVKDHAVTDGQYGGFRFHSDTTMVLRSTKPE